MAVNVTIANNVGPRGLTGSDASVTNANVVDAIESGPSAVRVATQQPEVDAALSRIQLDPRVAAHARRQRVSSVYALSRLNEWVKGIDALSLTVNEAVFLGSQFCAGSIPRSFIRGDEGIAEFGTFNEQIHGLVTTAGVGTPKGLYRFPIDDLGDFTMVTFYSGDGSVTANHYFAALTDTNLNGITSSSIQIRTTSTSGSSTVRLMKAGGTQAFHGTHSGFSNETTQMMAVKWEDGVEASMSSNGAAFQTPTAYAQVLSSSLVWLGVGGHAGTHLGTVVFDGLLTNEQIAAVELLGQRTICSSNIKLVVEGDSLMAGNGFGVWNQIARISGQWAGSTHSYSSLATGGETAKQVYDQAVAGSFDTFIPSTSSPEWWLILQAGTNDYGNHAATGDYTNAKILEHLTETCRIAKEAGCAKTILCTTLLRVTRKDDVISNNAAIVARTAPGMEYVDEVLDLDAAMAAVAGADYEEDSTYFADEVHPNATGLAVEAAALNSLILTTRAKEESF